MREKHFHIGYIVSAGAGVLVSPRLMEGVYDILQHMSGGPVWTHQIPRISREATPVLLHQHPALAQTFEEAKRVTSDNWRDWLARWVERHGETLPIAPMAASEHAPKDPVTELAEMAPPDRIVVVSSDD